MAEFIIWDNLDGIVHRGPWTKAECLSWMQWGRDIMPNPAGVDKVYKIQRFHRKGRAGGVAIGLIVGLSIGVGVTVWGVATDRIVIIKSEKDLTEEKHG